MPCFLFPVGQVSREYCRLTSSYPEKDARNQESDQGALSLPVERHRPVPERLHQGVHCSLEHEVERRLDVRVGKLEPQLKADAGPLPRACSA